MSEAGGRSRAMDELILEFDGGSRGNPGPAACGVVLRAVDGTPIVTLGKFIGRATNNVAEYQGLITGLARARELGAKRLMIRGDSELIVRQMLGIYRVKHPDLKPLYEEAQDLLREFDGATFQHVLRERNALADKLANLAMDRRSNVEDADDTTVDAPPPVETAAGDLFACPRCGCVISVKSPSTIRPHQLRPFGCQCGMKMNRVEES